MQRVLNMMLLAAATLLAACEAVPNARPISLLSPEAQRVTATLAHWPHPAGDAAFRRSFHLDLQAGDSHAVGTGTIEYHTPRDFRLITITDNAAILVDGRVNWGGTTILRQKPDLDTALLEDLLTDLIHAFDLPTTIEGLKANETKMVLTLRRADTHKYTWIFDRADGRLLETTVSPDLQITYGTTAPDGWPTQLRLTRRSLFHKHYDLTLTFLDH